MSDVASLIIGPSFTSKGTKYLHMFNISLCGHEVMFAFVGKKMTGRGRHVAIATQLIVFSGSPQGRRAATCSDNVTDVSNKEERSDAAQFVNSVESFICQSTIIPADGRGFRMSISSQSISLAETFIGKTPVKQATQRWFAFQDVSLCHVFQGRQSRPSWTASAPNQICFLTTQKLFQTSTSTTGRVKKRANLSSQCRKKTTPFFPSGHGR